MSTRAIIRRCIFMDAVNFRQFIELTSDRKLINSLRESHLNSTIKPEIIKVLDHIDELIKLGVEAEDSKINSKLKDLYRAIFEYKVIDKNSKVGGARITDVFLRESVGSRPIELMNNFNNWTDRLITRAIEKYNNEDVTYLAKLAQTVSNSELSISITGNEDTDLLKAIYEIIHGIELNLDTSTGFEITWGIQEGKIEVLDSKHGFTDEEEAIYTVDIDDPQWDEEHREKMHEEMNQAFNSMNSFIEILKQAVDDGKIDHHDLDNVTITIKK